MLGKVLIANRGEIAVRIIRTCREMGIRTVAVYSEADAGALHTHWADEAVFIGPSPPLDSYLRIDRILDTARQSGVDAIHPGYGFLAENADFAQAVEAAGLTFIGPPASVMRTMGSKTAARTTMEEAGIPVVPGYQASDRPADLLAAATRLGFPLLVKAVAGGGGKGMRVVDAAAKLPAALDSARREAGNAFGDERLYLEKLLPDPRHVEFQIVGDRYGNIVHLYERDCSVQRRHQKIVEETPSPRLDDGLRRRMGQAAVAAARAVDYANAGTVEFLVDDEDRFYFLEMNTRLQVEHPITEWITGVDLVKWQIQMAAGEPLPVRQADLRRWGHAIECRIYAEDPANDFLPATGRLLHWVEPSGPGVRVDSGVTAGDRISHHYDPLIAKLSVHAQGRSDALGRLARALQECIPLGDLVTNIAFLRDIVEHDIFRRGEATTNFIDHYFSNWQPRSTTPADAALMAVALADFLASDQAARSQTGTPAEGGDPFSPWQQSSAFRL